MKIIAAACAFIPLAATATPVDPNFSLDNSDDLGIRFNKFGHVTGEIMKFDYPMSYRNATWLRESTDAISTVHRKDCMNCNQDKGPRKFQDYIMDILGTPPSHPERNLNAPYWKELLQVVKVQEDRNNNVAVEEYIPLPCLWSGFSMEDVAMAVRNELPGKWHFALLETFLREGVTFSKVVPALGNDGFLYREVMLSGLNGAAIVEVGETNFRTKWTHGRARPEEVAWLINVGNITTENDGVPAELVRRIKAMNLADATDFTAYKDEGSPTHPSWPAMHSAGASGSVWMATVMDLTEEQFCEVQKLDFSIAYARTVAGVHYETDNIAGLTLGNKLVGDWLPHYLSDHYGSKKKVVRDRVKKVRKEVNWKKFLKSKCAKSSGSCSGSDSDSDF